MKRLLTIGVLVLATILLATAIQAEEAVEKGAAADTTSLAQQREEVVEKAADGGAASTQNMAKDSEEKPLVSGGMDYMPQIAVAKELPTKDQRIEATTTATSILKEMELYPAKEKYDMLKAKASREENPFAAAYLNREVVKLATATAVAAPTAATSGSVSASSILAGSGAEGSDLVAIGPDGKKIEPERGIIEKPLPGTNDPQVVKKIPRPGVELIAEKAPVAEKVAEAPASPTLVGKTLNRVTDREGTPISDVKKETQISDVKKETAKEEEAKLDERWDEYVRGEEPTKEEPKVEEKAPEVVTSTPPPEEPTGEEKKE